MSEDALAAVAWPVRTARLVVRRATGADLEPTWRFRRLPEVNDWLSGAAADLDAYREHFCRPGRLAKVLVVELDGAVIGDLMVNIEDGWAQAEVAERARGTQAELGWTLDPAHGGRGFATEAVRAVIGLCFGPLGLRRVYASCFADNEPSWRLMERLGMRREEHAVRDSLHRTRGWLDGYTYAVLADEWPVPSVRPKQHGSETEPRR